MTKDQKTIVTTYLIKELTILEFGISTEALRNADTQEPNIRRARRVLIYLCRKYTDIKLSALGRYLNISTDESVCRSYRLVKKAIHDFKPIKARIENIERLINSNPVLQ